jgi:rRNA maturation endonuclease Nob1
MNRDYENPVNVTRYDWLCPTCKSLLCRDIDVIDDNYHFCKVCGQAVKWE